MTALANAVVKQKGLYVGPVNVPENDVVVEKGAALFTLDDSVYRAQLADAEAKLKLAEQTHKRTSQLFSSKYATAQSADESASNLAVSTAAVELARVQLQIDAAKRVHIDFAHVIDLGDAAGLVDGSGMTVRIRHRGVRRR